MRGGFAAPRRPRSGFKESPQGCENEDAALNDLKRARERSRKERKALGSSSSSGRRSKRTRSGLGDQLYRGSDEDDGYDTVEVSHGGSPAPSHSRSEEDDEREGEEEEGENGEEPRRTTANHRRPPSTKHKSHKLSDDVIGAGLSSIPRKARSVFVKRPHESSPSAPPSDGIAVQPCIAAPSPSAKSGRRTKPPGTKPRPAKFAKVSASFSEREVEVAEVLFGFAKQFTNESCVEDANELKTSSPSSLPPSVVSPIRISSPVSVSASPLPPPTEAPKRKRPRVAPRTEEVRSPASTTAEQTCQSTEMDNLPPDNTDALGGFIKGIAPGPLATPESPQNYGSFVQLSDACLPSLQNHGALDRKTSEKVVAPISAENKAGVPEMVDGASELARSQTGTQGIDAPADMLCSGDSTQKIESSKMSPLSLQTEKTPMERLAEIDLMVSPLKETDCLDKEKDNGNDPNVVDNAGAEFSGGTVGIDSRSELKAVAVKQVIEEEKRKQGVEEGRENGDCKTENGVEKGIEQHCVKEEDVDGNKPGEVWKERDKDLSKQLLQKPGKITKSDPRTRMPERSDVSSSLVSLQGNISGFPSAAESLPLSMAVAAGWHGGLPPLSRYFGPSSATWPGVSSLPGVMSVEGNSTLAPTMQPGFILQSQQTLKRCAAHAYIAHFIEYQKQIARQPFWAATYSTSSALYGGKPYNLNIPLPPPTDSVLGGLVLGTASASSVRNSGTASHNIMGSSSSDSNVGQNLKEKVTTTYMDALWKHPVQQQAAQRTLSTIIQHAPPFGFPITESGASCSAAVNVGNASATTGRNSGSRPPSFHGEDPTTSIDGTTEVNSSLASMASAAQAQYFAMLQHNGYPVPLPHAHFGATNTGAHNHLGHQQIFNGSFYATHLIHPSLQTQQQGKQNLTTTSGLSSTQKQQQFNFSSLQQQPPSNSPHHHLFLSPQSVQVENEGNKVIDGASSVDKKLPMAQKSLHGQGTPSNSNNSNVNTSSLLAASLPIHTQDLTLMAGLGVKHTGKQQLVSMQHQGADPSLHMSWKGQQCNQNAKQAAGKSKTTAKSTASNYGDHVALTANHSNFQESGISSGQTVKQQQQDQHSPQWKVPSTIITSAGAPSQAVIVAAMRNLPQQGQYQSVNTNSVANSSGAAIPQSVFATSTKNYGQQPRNLHNNSGCSSASNTKSAGTPSKTASGNKGSIPRPQRSVAPISAKKSSPNHYSQSPSSKSSQKQYEQQQRTSSQAAVSGGSGQAAGSKNQQYYSQAHFNPQQSYQLQQALPQQIQQQLLFSQNQYIHQQAVQQSQLSAQSAQQAAVLQHPSMQGYNYSQPPFSNPPHRQQEQQQQILPISPTPSNPVCNETLSVGLPTLTLGSASTGRGAAKIMPGGSLRDNGTVTAILHPQYSPHNGTVSARGQSGNSQAATISSPYMQTVPIVSRKVGEQKVGSDGLNQDQVNGVLLLPNSVDLNMCAQANVNTSSVPSSSPRTTTGNLKKAQGENIIESMSNRGGTSAVSSGLAYQGLGASSDQTLSLSTNQHPVSLAAGPISSAISAPLEAAASTVHP